MKHWRVSGIKLDLDEKEALLPAKVASALSLALREIISLDVMKKAIDARRNKPPQFVYVLKIQVADDAAFPGSASGGIHVEDMEEAGPASPVKAAHGSSGPVVVIGGGPAGLFAAYVLAASGVSVTLLERGTSIEERTRDVDAFWRSGIFHPESNVLFGEGGAGTFSDGKLTSRTKHPHALWVKQTLVQLGAPDDILTDAKPHIGTDRLRKVMVNFRKKLIDMGCIVRFRAQVTDFVISRGAVKAVVVNHQEEIPTDGVIVAIGQSADDTYHVLLARGVTLQPKPFAMGLRAEHPQALINEIQYGPWLAHPKLPPAEYFVTAAIPEMNRSVYTFCMCPGGAVIGCAAFPGAVITNGMSNRLRTGSFANSAVVVNVRVEDFAPDGQPLAGLDFRRHWEQKAFVRGGGNYFAPAQKLVDFVSGKSSGTVGSTSFLPGVKSADLAEALPRFVTDALRIGIQRIDKKMPGFLSDDAHLIGVETRTSSPVRICRGSDGQCESVRGLYPAGEGAGYAGGIISSAIDGVGAACRLLAPSA